MVHLPTPLLGVFSSFKWILTTDTARLGSRGKLWGFFVGFFFVLKSRTHTMIVINATAEANLDSTANLMARLSEDLSQENNLNVKSRHCKSKFLCFSEIT